MLTDIHFFKVPINNPNELDEIYDSITYAKSNSVIRMLCNYLSEPVFKKGLQIYLSRFQYKNTQTTDLWDALSEASSKVSSTATTQILPNYLCLSFRTSTS